MGHIGIVVLKWVHVAHVIVFVVHSLNINTVKSNYFTIRANDISRLSSNSSLVFRNHLLATGGTRVFDSEPIDQALLMEGMFAAKNKMPLALFKILSTDRALTVSL